MTLLARILWRYRRGYSPPVSELSGYKTFVDPSSEKNLKVPDSKSDDRWPVELPQSREKERPLPLPSDHNETRDRVIGPTYYNKPDPSGGPKPRTVSVPGDQYGNPVKNDYNYVRRRQDVTAGVPKLPLQRQRVTQGPEKQKLKQEYLRHRSEKRRTEKMRYRQEGKWDPNVKRRRKLYKKYPARFTRRRPGEFNTPADRTKDWRENQKDEAKQTGRTQQEQETIRKRKQATADPSSWYTVTKETVPPNRLDQNFRTTPKGAPGRRDKTVQEGEPLKAPNLDRKPQKGLGRTKMEPKPNGGFRMPTLQSPGDGSGKVIPQNRDFVNHSQELPDRVPAYAWNMEQAKVGSLGRIVRAYLRYGSPDDLHARFLDGRSASPLWR